METFKKIVGKRIARRRKDKDVDLPSQKKLAKAMGIDRTRVAKWESGANLPTGELKQTLLRVLKTTEEELFAMPEFDNDDGARPWKELFSKQIADLKIEMANLKSPPGIYHPLQAEALVATIHPEIQAEWRAAAKEPWRLQVARFFLTGNPDHLNVHVPEELKRRLLEGLRFYRMSPDRALKR